MRKALYILLSAVAALAVVSCAKSLKGDRQPEEIDGGAKLSVRATLPSLAKGHMDGLDIKWDANDQIAVFASRLGVVEEFYGLIEENIGILAGNPDLNLTEEQKEDYASLAAYLYLLSHTHEMSMDYLTLSSVDANGKALFTSDKLLKDWLPEARNGEETYWFFAHYPASSVNFDFRAVEWTRLTARYYLPVYFPTMMVKIPTVQDGINWFDKQILFDIGTEDMDANGNIVDEEDPTFERSSGTASYDQLQNEGWLPEFDNFRILTSLLQFTISTQGESAVIDHIDVKMSSPERYVMSGEDRYITGTYPLSGEIPFTLTMDEDLDIRLWNRWDAPILDPYYLTAITKEDQSCWSIMENAESYVRLKFQSPISISATPGDTYTLVTAPTRNYTPTSELKPRLIFTAYDISGVATHRATYALSGQMFNPKHNEYEWTGLEEGTKYSFNLSLRPINDPSAGNAGEYDEINL